MREYIGIDIGGTKCAVVRGDESGRILEKRSFPTTNRANTLEQIFEHNTPLHDGAVLVRGNRIVAATCYLPLSDNMELSKQLGTRHRAGVGISEVSDSLTIIVSEETGQVSMAQNGQLSRGLTSAELRSALIKAQNKKVVTNSKLRHLLKGRMRHEEDKAD